MLVLFAFAGLAGTAVAVLPALAAAPSEVKLEVAQNCNTRDWPCWNPKGSPEGNVGFNEVAPLRSPRAARSLSKTTTRMLRQT